MRPYSMLSIQLFGKKIENYGNEKMKNQIEKFNKLRDEFIQYCNTKRNFGSIDAFVR